MKFSVPAFTATVVAVLVSGFVSFMDGTLSNKRVTIGFLNHGGMWGDLIIMSTVVGLALPYFAKSGLLQLSSFSVALVITIAAHAQWAIWMRVEGITGHIFPTLESGKWYLDISRAGWMHVLVMTMLLGAMFMCSLSPLPARVVVLVSFLVTVHIFLATMQPSWFCTGELWSWRNIGVPLFAMGLIWSIAVIKIRLASGS